MCFGCFWVDFELFLGVCVLGCGVWVVSGFCGFDWCLLGVVWCGFWVGFVICLDTVFGVPLWVGVVYASSLLLPSPGDFSGFRCCWVVVYGLVC